MTRILLTHANELVTCKGNKARRGKEMSDVGLIKDGAILINNDKIEAVGSTEELLEIISSMDDVNVIDCTGKTVMPGFVDSHTHFVFGGYRADEFAMRLSGVPYMEIMNKGGGINATTTPTREFSKEQLIKEGMKRLNAMLENGITTVEGKSGYGLDIDTEMKQLEVMGELNKKHPIDIIRTYMGAHATPNEFKDNTDKYIDLMVNEVMPMVAENKSAEFCDVFCEKNVFEIEQTRRILEKAKELGLKTKLHADEIVNIGGAELAAEMGSTSADHLLKVSDKGISELSKSNTVATLLPLTAFSLKEEFAPARKLIDSNCAVALATDLNPGSCFSQSVPLLIALATIYMGMTVEEAIISLTINGAAAIDRADKIGSLEVGKQADILILNCLGYNFLSYNFAMSQVETVIKNGIEVWTRKTAFKNN